MIFLILYFSSFPVWVLWSSAVILFPPIPVWKSTSLRALLGNTSLLLPSCYRTRAQTTTYPAKEGLRHTCTLGGVCLSRKMLLFLRKERVGAGDKPGFSGFPVIVFKQKPLSSCSGYALVNTVEGMTEHTASCLNINLQSSAHFLRVFRAQKCLDTDLVLLFRYQQCI